jgi:outer membrane protein OmpA-like peptidoglycan-associated protein
MMHRNLRFLVAAFVLGAAACASTNRELLTPEASAYVAPPAPGQAPVLGSGNEADGGALSAVAAEAAPIAAPALAPICAPKPAQAEPDAPKPAERFADRRAQEALDRLAAFVTIVDERRGRVITLRSDDLGEPGEWALSPNGSRKIDELVAALRLQGGNLIVVSGYTDSYGAPALNDALSLLRAQAVCGRLAGGGVALQDLRVEGLGARRPLGDNRTPDGRAQNRRVEIVISR